MRHIEKSKFEISIELLKIVIWPGIIILIIGLYYSDIKAVINNSSKVSVGSFSMEIIKEAKNQGFSELGLIITNLKEEEIRSLLSIAVTENYGLIGRNNTEYFFHGRTKIWEKLERNGLVAFENFNFQEVENYLVDLGASKNVIYYNDNGKYKFEEDLDFYIKSYVYIIDENNISNVDKQRLESFTISLTKNGKQSIDIIVKTIVEELNK